MGKKPLSKHAGIFFLLTLFFISGVSGAGPILAFFSSMDFAADLEVTPKSAAVFHHNKITLGPTDFVLNYKALKNIDHRPTQISFYVQLKNLGAIDFEFIGPAGQIQNMGTLGRSDFWQHAQKIHYYEPLKFSIEMDDNIARLVLDDDFRSQCDLPGWPVIGISIKGRDTALALFFASVKIADESNVQLADLNWENAKVAASTGAFLPAVPFMYPIIVLIVLGIGFLLILADNRMDQAFNPSQKPDRLALFFLIAGSYFCFSWQAPRTTTIFLFLVYIAAIKAASIRFHSLIRCSKPSNKKSAIYIAEMPLIVFVFFSMRLLFSSPPQSLGPWILLVILSIAFTIGSAVFFTFIDSRPFYLRFLFDGTILAAAFPWFVMTSLADFSSAYFYLAFGVALTGISRLRLSFGERKRLRFAQGAMVLAFLTALLGFDLALDSAAKSGPIPKMGDILSIESKWVPYNFFDVDFAGKVQPGKRIFQGKTLAVPKPRDEFRIVFLGGSTTFGSENDPRMNFVSQIQNRLDEHFPHLNIGVYNCSFVGYASMHMLLVYNKYIVDAAPDLLVFYLLNNDLYQPGKSTSREIYQRLEEGKGAPPRQTARSLLHKSALYRLGSAVRQEIGAGSRKDFAPADKIVCDFRANLLDILTDATAKGAKVLLVPELINPERGTDETMALAGEMRDTMQKLAEMPGVTFIDSWQKYAGYSEENLFTDNVHLNADGNAFVADMIFPLVKKSIPASNNPILP